MSVYVSKRNPKLLFCIKVKENLEYNILCDLYIPGPVRCWTNFNLFKIWYPFIGFKQSWGLLLLYIVQGKLLNLDIYYFESEHQYNCLKIQFAASPMKSDTFSSNLFVSHFRHSDLKTTISMIGKLLLDERMW